MQARIMGHTIEIDEQRVQGGVVGTRRESIGCKDATAQAGTGSSPRTRSASPLPVRSMPGIGAAGSNPAPAPHKFRSKLELAYAGYLHMLMLAGDIQSYTYEAVTLHLGHDCRLTPDFLVIQKDGTIELHEVKGGFAREDSLIKLRVAAHIFPWWKFILVKRIHGRWDQREMAK